MAKDWQSAFFVPVNYDGLYIFKIKTEVFNMTKKDFAKYLSKEANLTQVFSDEIVSAVFDSLTKLLSEGHTVKISGFGNFEVRERKEYYARNPRTGEKVLCPSCNVVSFKPTNALKEAVR